MKKETKEILKEQFKQTELWFYILFLICMTTIVVLLELGMNLDWLWKFGLIGGVVAIVLAPIAVLITPSRRD